MHSGKSGAASYLEPTLYLRKQIAHPILLFLFLLVTKPFYEVSVRCNGDSADQHTLLWYIRHSARIPNLPLSHGYQQ